MSPLKKITLVLLVSSLFALAVLAVYLTKSLKDSSVQQWVKDYSQASLEFAVQVGPDRDPSLADWFFPGSPGSLFLLDDGGALFSPGAGARPEVALTVNSDLVEDFLVGNSGLDSKSNPRQQEGIVKDPSGEGDVVAVLTSLGGGWTLGIVSRVDVIANHFQRTILRTAALAGALLLVVGGIALFIVSRIGLAWQQSDRRLQRSYDRLASNAEEYSEQLDAGNAARKKTEAALKERKHLLDAITNQTNDGITVADTEGRYIFVNPAFCKMMGYSEAELLQLTVFDMKSNSQDRSSFQKSQNTKGGAPLKVFLRRKDGTEFFSEVLGKMIEFGGKKAVLGTVRDITDRLLRDEERLNMERQLQHAQKLESLGVLAGGIAHDFNNLLMAILGNADLALAELSPGSPVRTNLMEIENASRRAAELARQMLAYSGKGRFEIEPIALGKLTHEIAHLLEVSLSKKVILKYDFAPNLPTFDGDVTQIRQIILNLITNASEAIGDHCGAVSLSTGVVSCDRAYLDSANSTLSNGCDEPLPEGDYTYLEVTDTGCGMDPCTVAKVFDPFFTTKFTGRGLGMSAVQGIVRGHRGAIRVFSEIGKGTTFKVLFKANALPNQVLDTMKTGSQTGHLDPPEQFSGTILVVDDEETVCAVGCKMLKHMGFKTLKARDGHEALQVFENRTEELICILLDLTMPNLDGERTYQEIRRLDSQIKVILCSGYNEVDATERFAGKGLAGFLQKPYNIATLREKLHQVLGA